MDVKQNGKCVVVTQHGVGVWVADFLNSEQAAFVSRACNAHDTLVTALKLIIETAANAPGREASARIATEAPAAAEAA